ncbi:MAG: putative transposase [Candidatus Methanolliviera sp. GoM_oil]|nr:MAG: putative transposase [Candidatus Methanolliviera sp. GoM_oil]
MRKTYKYRIYPSREQKTLIEEWLNICRVLYNDCLTERRDAWQSCRKSINYYDQQNQLPEIKTFDDGLKRVHSQVIQDVLKRIDKSFKNFFKKVKKKEKAGYPRYKPRSRYNSFTYPQSGFEISEDGKKLILSKIGSINIKKHRDIPENAKIKTCTIERDLNRWYACFSVEIEVEDLDQNEGIRNEITNPIGIDLGINHLITFSDGSTIDNPRYLAKSEKRLKRDQRRLSRAKKRSNNRKKRIFELAKTHRKVRDQRADLLHKISHSLVDTFDLIIFEDLNVRGMLKNHHLAKSISDVSWSQLTNFVSYKAEEAGRRVEFVNPKNTSQECSNCGGIVRKSLSQRVHKCPFCGLVMDRDENAALNILKKGLSRVGQELSKVKPEDFSKRRVIQEAPSVRVG